MSLQEMKKLADKFLELDQNVIEHIDGWYLGQMYHCHEISVDDPEAAGCEAKKVIIELLENLGLSQTAKAYSELLIW